MDLAGADLVTYLNSRQLQRLTERLLDTDESLRSDYSELREWIALRNVISHQYDNILPEAIWDSATEDVEDLIMLLERLVQS